MAGKSVWTFSCSLLLANPLTGYPIAYNPLLREGITIWVKDEMTTFFLTHPHNPQSSKFHFFSDMRDSSSIVFLTSHIQLVSQPMKGTAQSQNF